MSVRKASISWTRISSSSLSARPRIRATCSTLFGLTRRRSAGAAAGPPPRGKGGSPAAAGAATCAGADAADARAAARAACASSLFLRRPPSSESAHYRRSSWRAFCLQASRPGSGPIRVSALTSFSGPAFRLDGRRRCWRFSRIEQGADLGRRLAAAVTLA